MKELNPRTASHIRWASAGAIVTAVLLGSVFMLQERAEPPVVRPDPGGGAQSHDAHGPAKSAPRAPVHVTADRAAMLGLVVEPVTRSDMDRSIRAAAVVVPDEARLSHVHTRVSGWIEQLYINTTGQSVRRGQPVADVFSRELIAAQGEYLVLLRLKGGQDALEAARARLEVLGMGKGAAKSLERRGKPMRSVTVVAPRSGVVLRRNVTVGTAVDPGTELVTIADLSHVWVLAEVPEAAMADVAVGDHARIELPASGTPPFETEVAFLYPTLSEQTRTLRVRFEVDNGEGHLRPGMYGTAQIGEPREDVLTIPRDAVVDTGLEQHVFVMAAEGHYVPRKVELGARTAGRVEVKKGLEEGEQIVASGVFLLDSESRLRASSTGSGHSHGAH